MTANPRSSLEALRMKRHELINWLVNWREEHKCSRSPYNNRRHLETWSTIDLIRRVEQIQAHESALAREFAEEYLTGHFRPLREDEKAKHEQLMVVLLAYGAQQRRLDAALVAQPAADCRFMRPPQDRPCAKVYPEDQTRWCGTCLLAALARQDGPQETP